MRETFFYIFFISKTARDCITFLLETKNWICTLKNSLARLLMDSTLERFNLKHVGIIPVNRKIVISWSVRWN